MCCGAIACGSGAEANCSSSSTSSNTSSSRTWLAYVRSYYMGKQRVARCSKIAAMLNIGVAGCLLEVRFAGLHALDAGKCAVFCSCAKFAQLCIVCTDEISSLAV